MNRLVLKLLLLPFLFGLLFVSPAATRMEGGSEFEAERARVLSFIIRQHLARYHFSGKAFDDDLSGAAFSLFLEQVDSQKRFLISSDVVKLRAYEWLIDDEMVLGQIELPVVALRMMRQRVDRVEGMVEKLLREGFDFKAEDRFEIDPKKRPFCASEGELEERWRKLLKYQINTAIRTENGGFQGIAFAVPVNTMKRIVPQLIEQGSVQYSWLGITSPAAEGGYSVAALADELNLPVRNGILVSEVTPGSPAARAGLRAGTQTTTIRGVPIPVDSDIIVAVNGQMIRDIDSLVAYLVENTSPGDTITLTIVRAGQTLDLDVTLGARP